jgi:transglutaminase-like putative cysteine protease
MIERMADLFGLSIFAVYATIIAIALFAYYVHKKDPKSKQKRNYAIIIGIAAGILILTPSLVPTPATDTAKVEWQDDYSEKLADLPNSEAYLGNTIYYDYDSRIITDAADSIADDSKSSREAIENAMRYVYKNVEYTFGESDDSCLQGTAPAILQSGKGQCDTQSIVLVSLLRKMGVAANPVGGCIMLNPGCRLQSVLANSGFEFAHLPKYTVEEGIYDPGATDFSRGGMSREGGLHAWVAAWTPEDGWLTLEVTTGLIADTKCYNYHVELIPGDNQKSDICVSKNWNYAKACQTGDLENLDDNGLGLTGEVLV